MPLYVDEKTILNHFKTPVLPALLRIRAEIGNRPVVPSMALRLIKKHLLPIAPEVVEKAIAEVGDRYTWDDIFHLYICVGSESKYSLINGEIASAINLIHRYTILPYRELDFPDPFDVTGFLHTCGCLRLPAKELRLKTTLDPLRFCNYCWRKALPNRQLCAVCGASNKLGEQVEQSRTVRSTSSFSSNANRKGRRLKPYFDKCLNRLLTAETIEFHDSGFEFRIIPPSSGIREWLAKHRPNLWDALTLEQKNITDSTAVEILISLLDDVQCLPTDIQRKQAAEVANLMKENQFMIGPMLIRAEAWLIANKQMSDRWGGKRTNSGRKKRT